MPTTSKPDKSLEGSRLSRREFLSTIGLATSPALMVESVGVLAKTLVDIAEARRDIEKTRPMPSEEALERARKELKIYDKRDKLYNECRAKVSSAEFCNGIKPQEDRTIQHAREEVAEGYILHQNADRRVSLLLGSQGLPALAGIGLSTYLGLSGYRRIMDKNTD